MTRYNKCGRIGTKWLVFFYLYWYCVVVGKNIDKKLANRISYQIWYKGCLKGKSGRGVRICEGGGPYPLADLDREVQIRGGPNPLLHLHVVDAGFVWGLRKKLFYSCHQFEDGWIRNSWRGITTDQVRSRLEIGWIDVYSRTMLIHLPFSRYLRDLFFVLD